MTQITIYILLLYQEGQHRKNDQAHFKVLSIWKCTKTNIITLYLLSMHPIGADPMLLV